MSLNNSHEYRMQKLEQKNIALEAKNEALETTTEELATQNAELIRKTACIQKTNFAYQGSGWIRLAQIGQGTALLFVNTGGGSHGCHVLLKVSAISGYVATIEQIGTGLFANKNLYTKARIVRKNASISYVDIYKTEDLGAKGFELQSLGYGIQLQKSGQIITSIGDGYTATEINLSNISG